MIKNIFNLVLIFLAAAVFFSCKSASVIPPDATYAQLIQLGQDAFSSANYRTAERYYMAVIHIEARYELGHLYLSRKRYADAYRTFNEILGIFENAEYGTIPAAYRKLALMGMDKIPEKYKNQAQED